MDEVKQERCGGVGSGGGVGEGGGGWRGSGGRVGVMV